MEPMLAVKNLTKRFGGLTAVDNVSMEVYPAEVVGLVGDNGAGKSTLIKMISGVYTLDGGKIYFEGREVNVSSPGEARNLGIETIYQDLALAENLDVGSNIFLGREPLRPFLGGVVQVVDQEHIFQESARILGKLDIHIPNLAERIGNLSSGQRQAVAIARALYWKTKLLIMDEPTTALGVPERLKVLDLVRTLRDQSVSVILISQNLQDIFTVADRIVVLRCGQKVGERRASQTSPDEITRLMMGTEAAGGLYHSSPGLTVNLAPSLRPKTSGK